MIISFLVANFYEVMISESRAKSQIFTKHTPCVPHSDIYT